MSCGFKCQSNVDAWYGGGDASPCASTTTLAGRNGETNGTHPGFGESWHLGTTTAAAVDAAPRAFAHDPSACGTGYKASAGTRASRQFRPKRR